MVNSEKEITEAAEPVRRSVSQSIHHPFATRVALGLSSLLLIGMGGWGVPAGSAEDAGKGGISTLTPDIPGTIVAVLTAFPTQTPTALATPDIPGTLRALLTTPTPVGAATPDIPGTVRAAIATLSTPAPTIQANAAPGVVVVPVSAPQAAGRDVLVVHPDVVKPEVVKPEIVKVPEIMTVQVPVPATPDPDIISLHKRDFNIEVERRAQQIAADKLAEAAKLTPTLVPTYAPRTVVTETKTGEGFPWWGTALIAGGIGFIIGAGVFYRERIVQVVRRRNNP